MFIKYVYILSKTQSYLVNSILIVKASLDLKHKRKQEV